MKKTFIWAVVVLLFAGLACNLPSGAGDGAAPAEGLPDVESDSFAAKVSDEALLESVDLSGAQRQVLAVRGTPNRFMIRFSDGMREETWYYDSAGYDVTFRNGDTYTENQGDPVPVQLVLKSDYVPWWFNGAMTLSELLVATEADTFASESLDEVFGEAVSLITLPGMDAGFRGDELLFVRALPMEAAVSFSTANTDTVEPTEQPETDVSLTAAEQVHEGTHAYDVYCTFSDGLTDEYSDTITWTFTAEGLYEDDSGPYPQYGENYYSFSDEAGSITFYFKEDIITMTGEFPEENDQGEMVMISFVCGYTQK